jgi:hypothetical protein
MSDPGATERNNLYAQIALDRARIRNGGNGVVPENQPDSVVATDLPSMAVDVPRRRVGSNEGGE